MFFPFSFYDPTVWLVIPAIILSIYAQMKVKSTYNKFANVANARGLTGAEAAHMLLDAAGIRDVTIVRVPGSLTDHYDPRNLTLSLSDAVYGSASLAAVGVAAHETGHAIQHNQGYMPLNLRNNITPAAQLGGNLAVPLVILGLVFGASGGWLINVGILLYLVVVAFQLVTLPVEFNASRRAMELLEDQRILTAGELEPARKVLSAAAMTYVAATLASILTLLRLVLLGGRRR